MIPFSGRTKSWIISGLVFIAALEGFAFSDTVTVSDSLTWFQERPAIFYPAEKKIPTIKLAMYSAAPDSDPVDRKNPNYILGKVKEWRAATVNHDPGNADDAAVSIGSWDAEDLEIVLDYIAELASKSPKTRRRLLARTTNKTRLLLTQEEIQKGDLNRLLKQGALLHTDIALLNLENRRPADISEVVMAVVDSRAVRILRKVHWSYARRLINAISPSPSKDPMARQWYIATTAHMQSVRDLAAASANIESALEIFPSDYQILFYAGALHETWASPLNQNIQLSPRVEVVFDSKEKELKKARKLYEKAIDSNPDSAEGHLRLGRVLGLLDLHIQALVTLQAAESLIEDPQLSYYASLYLGHELEMTSRLKEAREHFENAATLYPTAQSPLLALSRLAFRRNDTEEAQTDIQRLFALPRQDISQGDPFWEYDLSHVRNADTLIDEMRRTFGELPR